MASCTFGLNQIITLSDDVKFIKAMVKDHLVPSMPKDPPETTAVAEEDQQK